MWLLPAMVVAGLTRDFSEFVVAVVLLLVLILLSMLQHAPQWAAEAGRSPLVHAILVPCVYLGPLLLLAYLYRTRDVRWKGRAAAAPLLVAWYLLSASSTSPFVQDWQPSAAALSETPPTTQRVNLSVEIEGRTLSAYRRPLLSINVRAAILPDSTRLLLLPDSVLLHLRDSSTLRLKSWFVALTLQTKRPPVEQGLHWIDKGLGDGSSSGFALELTDEQDRALSVGVASMELWGRVRVAEPRILASVPFASGPPTALNGMRLQIDSVTRDAGSVQVDVRTMAISSGEWFSRQGNMDMSTPRFALINDLRHEALVFKQTSGSSTGIWFVLPGTYVMSTSDHLFMRGEEPENGNTTRDAAWFHDARFVSLAWIPRGSYAVHVRSAVPPQSAAPPRHTAPARLVTPLVRRPAPR